MTGNFGSHDRCATPGEGVELSDSLPDRCYLINDSYYCPAGGPYTLKFVHSNAKCLPSKDGGTECIFPESGLAYGQCGELSGCANGVQAAQVGPSTPLPPTPAPTTLPPSQDQEFQVSAINTGGGNAGVPQGEWICLQSADCSYAPQSLLGWRKNQFDNYATFTEYRRSISGDAMIVLDDGSAKYGNPVCPTTNCSAVVFSDDYMQGTRATCPIGTEMVLSMTGKFGDYDRCVTVIGDTILSSNLPGGCYLINDSYCCPAGGPYTLRFVHSSAMCQPSQDGGTECIFPEFGFAYGRCGELSACAKGIEAYLVDTPFLPTPAPNTLPSSPFPTLAPSSRPTLTPSQAPESQLPFTFAPSSAPEIQMSAALAGPIYVWICFAFIALGLCYDSF